MGLNEESARLCATVLQESERYRIGSRRMDCGATVIDFGVEVDGGLRAGVMLARICMGGRCEMRLSNGGPSSATSVFVSTDDPVNACMAAQYAGWPVQQGTFYAMGSGPMRVKRGREHVLEQLGCKDLSPKAVGVLECDRLPEDDVCQRIADECHVSPEQLTLCVAPTRSLAGTIQVVARSVETCMHKLFELGFELRQVVSACGTAPLPPPATDFVQAIGRTNDSILYGGEVTLWIKASDEAVLEVLAKLPSNASPDWGKPFAEIFKKYHGDFYQVDPGLFAPAVIHVVNLSTGNSWTVGTFRPDVLASSFQWQVGLADVQTR